MSEREAVRDKGGEEQSSFHMNLHPDFHSAPGFFQGGCSHPAPFLNLKSRRRKKKKAPPIPHPFKLIVFGSLLSIAAVGGVSMAAGNQ